MNGFVGEGSREGAIWKAVPLTQSPTGYYIMDGKSCKELARWLGFADITNCL